MVKITVADFFFAVVDVVPGIKLYIDHMGHGLIRAKIIQNI
jgi:hypothetical protein